MLLRLTAVALVFGLLAGCAASSCQQTYTGSRGERSAARSVGSGLPFPVTRCDFSGTREIEGNISD